MLKLNHYPVSAFILRFIQGIICIFYQVVHFCGIERKIGYSYTYGNIALRFYFFLSLKLAFVNNLTQSLCKNSCIYFIGFTANYRKFFPSISVSSVSVSLIFNKDPAHLSQDHISHLMTMKIIIILKIINIYHQKG